MTSGQSPIRDATKRWLFSILRVRAFNSILRGFLRPLLPILPNKVIGRVPVVGRIRVRVPPSGEVRLAADGTDSLASRLYWEGLQAFEPETVGLYMHLLQYSTVVLDIGAYTGMFALLAAIGHPERIVHAFEPVPEIFDGLLKNIQANQLDNVRPVWGAVTNHDGEALLHIPRTITLPFSASTKEGFRKAHETIVVPALRLDSYVAANDMARVDLLKIDTEGTEHDVLEGARAVLKRDRPFIICEVLRGQTEYLLHSMLGGTTYRYFHITKEGLILQDAIEGDPSYKERNYLFIPEGRVPAVLQERGDGRWTATVGA